MDSEDLMLRTICGSAMAERSGYVFTCVALDNMANDLATLDAKLNIDPLVREILTYAAEAQHTETVE